MLLSGSQVLGSVMRPQHSVSAKFQPSFPSLRSLVPIRVGCVHQSDSSWPTLNKWRLSDNLALKSGAAQGSGTALKLQEPAMLLLPTL